jgi:hypothetical protein
VIDIAGEPHRDDPLAWLAHADELDEAGRHEEAASIRWRGRMLQAAHEAVTEALAGPSGTACRRLEDGSQVDAQARPRRVTLYLSATPVLKEFLRRFHLDRSLLTCPGYLFKRVRELWGGTAFVRP